MNFYKAESQAQCQAQLRWNAIAPFNVTCLSPSPPVPALFLLFWWKAWPRLPPTIDYNHIFPSFFLKGMEFGLSWKASKELWTSCRACPATAFWVWYRLQVKYLCSSETQQATEKGAHTDKGGPEAMWYSHSERIIFFIIYFLRTRNLNPTIGL